MVLGVMMVLIIDGLEIFYQRSFGKGIPVLLLHGWGGSSKTVQCIFDFLVESGRSVISVDLPGFGQSEPPPSYYGIYDYARLVEKFITELSIDELIVLGHSFGGRIATLLASRTKLVHSLVLVDSAGMKPRRKLSYYIKIYRYKRLKKRNKDVSSFGSTDYRELTNSMREVFTRVVNQHLESELKRIECPTLIIFGENDVDTPLYMARRLARGIKDSGIVVMSGCGHYSYLESKGKFNLILNEFIKGS